jgi:hypothetical protein
MVLLCPMVAGGSDREFRELKRCCARERNSHHRCRLDSVSSNTPKKIRSNSAECFDQASTIDTLVGRCGSGVVLDGLSRRYSVVKRLEAQSRRKCASNFKLEIFVKSLLLALKERRLVMHLPGDGVVMLCCIAAGELESERGFGIEEEAQLCATTIKVRKCILEISEVQLPGSPINLR